MSFIEEIKMHKNKETQRFLCKLLYKDTGYLVLSFTCEKEGKIDGILVEKGSTTIGHYWSGKGYVVWRMFRPDGKFMGTLFHICRDISIGDSTVSYLDLIVDIWISPDGTSTVLDEDELEACKQSGLITHEESHFIERQKIDILKNYKKIIDSLNNRKTTG